MSPQCSKVYKPIQGYRNSKDPAKYSGRVGKWETLHRRWHLSYVSKNEWTFPHIAFPQLSISHLFHICIWKWRCNIKSSLTANNWSLENVGLEYTLTGEKDCNAQKRILCYKNWNQMKHYESKMNRRKICFVFLSRIWIFCSRPTF